MRRFRLVDMVLGVLILAGSTAATAGPPPQDLATTREVDEVAGVTVPVAAAQQELTSTYLLEIPTIPGALHPNAVPGFAGEGSIHYSPTAVGGVYLLVSISTNTPNSDYWLMINPAPAGEASTGDYRPLQIRTDSTGVGYAAAFIELPAGTWEFHGVMVADEQPVFARDFVGNTPLCFPGPMGPLTVTAA